MKMRVNFFVDVIALIAFGACAVTGAVKMPELNVAMSNETYEGLSLLHDWSGIVSLALVAAHVLLHARWFAAAGKKIFGRDGAREAAGAETAKARRGKPKKIALIALVASVLTLGGANLWAHGRGANATIPQGVDYPAGTLIDGTYTGTATGYQPNLQVRVTVAGGSISKVEVIRHSETMRWYYQVVPYLTNAIAAADSTDIDSVSGATSSSHGILSAVENALASAKK